MNRALVLQVRDLAEDRSARATIHVPAINDPATVAFRAELVKEGVY